MRCGCVCPIVHTRQIIGFLVHHIQQLLNFIRTGKLKIETQNDRRLLARNQLYHQLGNYLNKYMGVWCGGESWREEVQLLRIWEVKVFLSISFRN